MSFINPIWLYGLLGLLVPIFIHLWSKKEGKTIKVGSIQFFPESETRQSSKLHLNEILLLLLRTFMLALLVMLIAQPIIISAKKRDKTTVLIEPALLVENGLGRVLDTLLSVEYNVKLLTTGLPDYDSEATQTYPKTDYWQLNQDIEQLASNEVIVFSSSRLVNFKGKVPASSKDITWYNVPPKYNVSQVLEASVYEGVYNVLLGKFEEGQTGIERISFVNRNEASSLQFRNSNGAEEVKHKSQDIWLEVKPAVPTLITINYDEEFETDARLLAAAFQAIQATNGIPVQVDLALILEQERATDNANIDVWLSNKVYIQLKGIKSLIYRDNMYNNNLIHWSNIPNQYVLTRRLGVANMTTDDLPESLLQTLFDNKALTEQVNVLDQRSIESQLIAPTKVTEGTIGVKEQLAIPQYYWIVFMALMALERIISFQRKQ